MEEPLRLYWKRSISIWCKYKNYLIKESEDVQNVILNHCGKRVRKASMNTMKTKTEMQILTTQTSSMIKDRYNSILTQLHARAVNL